MWWVRQGRETIVVLDSDRTPTRTIGFHGKVAALIYDAAGRLVLGHEETLTAPEEPPKRLEENRTKALDRAGSSSPPPQDLHVEACGQEGETSEDGKGVGS